MAELQKDRAGPEARTQAGASQPGDLEKVLRGLQFGTPGQRFTGPLPEEKKNALFFYTDVSTISTEKIISELENNGFPHVEARTLEHPFYELLNDISSKMGRRVSIDYSIQDGSFSAYITAIGTTKTSSLGDDACKALEIRYRRKFGTGLGLSIAPSDAYSVQLRIRRIKEAAPLAVKDNLLQRLDYIKGFVGNLVCFVVKEERKRYYQAVLQNQGTNEAELYAHLLADMKENITSQEAGKALDDAVTAFSNYDTKEVNQEVASRGYPVESTHIWGALNALAIIGDNRLISEKHYTIFREKIAKYLARAIANMGSVESKIQSGSQS